MSTVISDNITNVVQVVEAGPQGASGALVQNLANHATTTAVDTVPRIFAGANTSPGTTGNMYFSFFTPLINATVTQVSMACTSVAAAGATMARIGLYTWDGATATLVAATANDTTLWNATNTVFTRSFDTSSGLPASYNLVAGQRYAVAAIYLGTTAPSLQAVSVSIGSSSLDPRVTGLKSSQTDLPTSASGLATTGNFFWARLS